MIRYLESGQIERDKWDKCISDSQADLIYGCSWYLDLVSPGWCGLVEDDYLSVMPLPAKKKYGVNYIIQPVYTQQLGIFSARKCEHKKIIDFIGAIPAFYRFIDINLNFSNDPHGLPFLIKINKNHELDLSGSTEDIRSDFSNNTRRNIRHAMKKVLIREKVPVTEHVQLIRKNAGFYMGTEHISRMKKFMERLMQIGAGWIIGAFIREELCASVFMLEYGGRITYLIPGSTGTGKKEKAMFAIVNYVVEKYAGTDTNLDFEGSNHEGIARFYQGFGAKLVNYTRLRINHLPFPYKLLVKK